MKRIVTRAFTIIGALILAGFVLVLGIGMVLWLSPARVPAKTILEADFERGLVEYVPNDPLASVLLAPASTVRDVVEA